MGSSRTTPLARRRKRRLPPAAGLEGPVRAQVGRCRRACEGTWRAVKRPSWKVVGLAGIAGVAATGVVVARNRRAHRDLPPDELRERLHGRLAEVGSDPARRPGELGPAAGVG